MKKVYLSIAIGMISLGSIAQVAQKQKNISVSQTIKPNTDSYQEKVDIWTNDFSTSSDWTIQDLGTTGDNWVIGTGVPSGTYAISGIQSTTAANGFALFDSDLMCSGNQNSIVYNTTPVDLGVYPYVTLEFESYYRKFQGTAYVGFSTDAVNWTYVEVHTNLGANDATENPEIVSVAAPVIAGSPTAYICFRYQGGCDYAWMVDDVKIVTTPSYDLKTTYSLYHSEFYQYSQIPLLQVAPTKFNVGVTNNGVNDLTNIMLAVDVTGQETTTLNSVPVATSVTGQVDTLTVSYTPSALGVYNFAQTLSLNETDENPANNSGLPNVSFEVTNNTYAVDKGAPYADYPALETIFLDATIPYTELGNSFDIYANQDLYAIDVHLSTASTQGGEFYGILYEYNSSASSASDLWTNTGNETDLFTIDASTTLGDIVTLNFTSPVSLAPGTYMISVRESSDGAVFSRSGFTTGNTQSWCWINSTSNGPSWTGLSSTPVVRMNFDASVSVANAGVLEGVKVYPNPSTGVINVSNDLNIENTVVVTDISGKLVTSKKSSVATTIDLGAFGAGVYMIEVSNLNGKKVERVVIK